MPPPGVSVVIVNWNTRDMVLRLLASLSSPSGKRAHDMELIVVDNDSRDGSVEAIRREFPDVEIIAQTENRGFAGGVNPGVAAAKQPLVLLLNSDAETTRASIADAARYMGENPEVGILGPQILSPERNLQTSAWREPSLVWLTLSALGLSKLRILDFEHYYRSPVCEPAEVDCVSGCAMMIRRELLNELGGFDEDYFMYFEETDFCVRARRHGKKVHHAPVGEFVHAAGGTSRSVRLRTFLDFRRSQILFQRKHRGVAAAIATRGLLIVSSALRVPPLAALSLTGRSDRAGAQLKLHLKALAWLGNLSSGLVPEVDRSE